MGHIPNEGSIYINHKMESSSSPRYVLIDKDVGESTALHFGIDGSMNVCKVAKALEDRRCVVLTKLESPDGLKVVHMPRDDQDALMRDINTVPDTSRSDGSIVVYYVVAPPPAEIVRFVMVCSDTRQEKMTLRLKAHKDIKASAVARKIATRLGMEPEKMRRLGCVKDPASSDDAVVADIFEDFESFGTIRQCESFDVEYEFDSDPGEEVGGEEATSPEVVVKKSVRRPMTRSHTRESVTRSIRISKRRRQM